MSPPESAEEPHGAAHDRGGEAVPEAGRVGGRAALEDRRGTIRQRFTRCPISDSRAGSSVAEAAIETSGTSRPPTPIERMNGSGMNTSSASPTATVRPLNSVARPAVAIVVRSAVGTSSSCASSSRKRNTTSIE